MIDTAPWVVTALMSLVSLLGLALASRAQDGAFALFGWALMLFGIAMIIGVFHRGGATRGDDRP
ncbi:MAG TPA: hypothetical protein VHL31_01780 [Geminicoccus sp.]|jgi:hypothetical protein|uniref:hypothetical protein n=1 Tax=Geminicoccus sp. TaxID=2024832 RepID=UPI002E32566D|nr:hypothetical protein [Geminicoccus sp.]HEX2525016.1 hypothetical protein [Geminicoccus sp.]